VVELLVWTLGPDGPRRSSVDGGRDVALRGRLVARIRRMHANGVRSGGGAGPDTGGDTGG